MRIVNGLFSLAEAPLKFNFKIKLKIKKLKFLITTLSLHPPPIRLTLP